MYLGNGFLVKTIAEALDEIRGASAGYEVRQLDYPVVSISMTYFISNNGVVWGCHKHHGFYLVTPLTINKRYKKGPCFRLSIGPHKEKEIYLAYALFNTFCSDSYDENLELEFIDGNPYNVSLSNLKRKIPSVSLQYVSNINMFSEVYRQYFDRAVRFCLWLGGIKMRLEEAKDVASDAFYEMCRYKTKPELAANLWLHICKKRTLDRNFYKSKFYSLYNDNGEEYLGLNPEYIDTGMWKHVKGVRSLEYLRWWATGETPTAVAEITNSTLSSVGSSITRSVQHLQNVYKKDIMIWRQADKRFL